MTINKEKSRLQNGFSLIELLIVVAIIGIISAIAIPNLLASRRAANEGSAQQSLRTIFSAEVTYQVTNGNGNFGTLTRLENAMLLDSVLGGGSKSGYTFVATPTDANPAGTPPTLSTFFATANPVTVSGPSQTGTRRFGLATDGVLRGDAVVATLGTAYTAATLPSASPMGN